jgi:hypothetical protein
MNLGIIALAALADQGPVMVVRCPRIMKVTIPENAIATRLAKNSRNAPAASVGRPRAIKIPQVVNGGTRAVAMATPTAVATSLGEAVA